MEKVGIIGVAQTKYRRNMASSHDEMVFEVTNKVLEDAGLTIGDIDNTTDNSPMPFVLRNDGNTELNVTVNFTDLWDTASNPTDKFQYKIRNNSLSCFLTAGTQESWTNAPSTQSQAINRLNFTLGYQTGCNNVSVDIFIEVPPGEPSGDKSSLITFISSLGEPGFGAD